MPDDAARQARLNGFVVGPAGSRQGEIIAAVRSAIRLGNKLTFAYTNAEGVSFGRLPLDFFDKVEMLAAWCEERGAFRHFRLDRMQDELVTDQRIPLGTNRLLARYREVEPGAAL